MKTLFLIPARGGSKGIPGKNIKPLHDKPLIYYSIDVARKFTEDENICVSTDNVEIFDTVKQYGLNVPFMRPPQLATDNSSTNDVCLHALDFYEKEGIIYDTLVILQPTSPFRKEEHIKAALDLYSNKIQMVVSVKETSSNPYYVLFEEDENGYLVKSKSGDFSCRQDCPKVWEYNGAVYVINIMELRKGPFHKFSKIVKVEMDDYSSLDLDSPIDWLWAEFLMDMKAKQKIMF